MLICFSNDFYNINYTFIYFYNFTNEVGENLNNLIDEIINILNSKRLDENFINKFLENQTLETYEIELSDISNSFKEIEKSIKYINTNKNTEYKNYLYDTILTSYNLSYHNLINDFLLDELIHDIINCINNRIEIYLDFMKKKIQDEYNYYLLILNTTDELGESSKIALIDLSFFILSIIL